MLPKRKPGSNVPPHVEQLAKHRHRGLDFIFVSQSPQKQVDEFVHDLIERQVHVRRRFGSYVNLRIFENFEAKPLKATPIKVTRQTLPKRAMGLYESTVVDTSDRSPPWYYIALPILLIATLAWWYFSMKRIGAGMDRGVEPSAEVAAKAGADNEDGAVATGEADAPATPPTASRSGDYVAWLTPRISGQPWTAPAFDNIPLTTTPPRVFCMASGENLSSCSCITEQGTDYTVDIKHCRIIATRGQYEPLRDVEKERLNQLNDVRQQANLRPATLNGVVTGGISPVSSSAGTIPATGAPAYGAMADRPGIEATGDMSPVSM
jgi:hypothetical protein